MISVVVPVYNVESCLEKCVESILAQSYTDFEVLLIDDGSTDSSGKICDEYTLKDNRISAYHKQNGGLADARNYGIARAKGDYITFIDSDDYILKNYLDALYGMLIDNGADISSIRLLTVFDTEHSTEPVQLNEVNVTDSEDGIRRMLLRRPIGVSACGKLYKKALFDGVAFPVGRLYEDMICTPYVFAKAKKVAYSDTRMYCYFQRKGSITNNRFTDKNLQMFDGLNEIKSFVEKNYPKLGDAMECRYIDDTLILLYQRSLWQSNYKHYASMIKKRDKSIWVHALKNPYLKKSRKLQLGILLVSTDLYRLIYKTKLMVKGE